MPKSFQSAIINRFLWSKINRVNF